MKLLRIGLLFLFTGLLLLIVSASLLVVIGLKTNTISFGGCIILFFIPVCIGIGEQWHWVLLLSVIILASTIVFYIYSIFYFHRKTKLTQ
ncbi:MAG: hypothetical protein QXE81_04095 [Desulfurococcaceae archaeon]